jgi:hypothetical protein
MRLRTCYIDSTSLVGSICMTLSVPGAAVNISLCDSADPVPNIIRWMEALITDVMECGFRIEEEGPEKYFTACNRWNGRLFLSISEAYRDSIPYIDAVVHRRQLIETIYRGFQAFGKSADYIAGQWARETLGDFLCRQTGSNRDGVVAFLRGLDTRSRELFYLAVAYPSGGSEPPPELEHLHSLHEMLEFALQPDNPLVAESLIEVERNRREALQINADTLQSLDGLENSHCVIKGTLAEWIENLQWLDSSDSPHWGIPLDILRSEALEAYLASDRDRIPVSCPSPATTEHGSKKVKPLWRNLVASWRAQQYWLLFNELKQSAAN